MSTENKIDTDKLNQCSVCKKLCSSKCSNCGQAFYCCIEHQKSDWKRHKINCHPFMVKLIHSLFAHIVIIFIL